jgi:hypothetical protein
VVRVRQGGYLPDPSIWLFQPSRLLQNLTRLGQNRRMSKDYEKLPESGEAFIYVAMRRLMVRRLARL